VRRRPTFLRQLATCGAGNNAVSQSGVNQSAHSTQGFELKKVALKIVLNTDSAAAFGSSFGMVILK